MWRIAFIGAGMGFAMPTLSAASMASLPAEVRGVGSGSLNTLRQVGFTLGVAVLVAIFSHTVAINAQTATTQAVGYVMAQPQIPAPAKAGIVAEHQGQTPRRRPQSGGGDGGRAPAHQPARRRAAGGSRPARRRLERSSASTATSSPSTENDIAKSFKWPFYAAALAALLAIVPGALTGRRLGEYEGHEKLNRAERAAAADGGRGPAADGAVGPAPPQRRTRRPAPTRRLRRRPAPGRRARVSRPPTEAEPAAATALAHRRARTGRRPGESGARDAILAAARAEFARAATTALRSAASPRRAGVDPALVHHYFGAKEQLFETALELPVSPAALLPALLADDPDRIGEQVVRRFLTVWEDPANRPIFMAMLRSVVSNEQAAELVRRLLVKEVFGPLATALGVPDAELRATLAGSQFIGLALLRYVGRVEPLASADLRHVAAAVGPTHPALPDRARSGLSGDDS